MNKAESERYVKSYETDFWQQIFNFEADFINECIGDARNIISVGCGPGQVEKILCAKGLKVTGIDISVEALGAAPDCIRKIVGRAEDMSFSDGSFEAAIYVASLQFVDDYRKAIEKTADVLMSCGRIIVMLLNPESLFYKEKASDPGSYVSKIRHIDLKEIEKNISRKFHVFSGYHLGIRNKSIFSSHNPEEAVLYILFGIKK